MIPEWWNAIEDELLECLTCQRPMSPGEIGAKLGISQESVTSLLLFLAQEGRVRISLVESVK